MTVTVGMTVILVIEMIVTVALVMTAAGTTVPPPVNALALLVAVMKIVALGRHPKGKTMMTGDLQGTMIDEEVMMIDVALTHMLIAVGMTVGVKKRTATMKGPQEPMETTDGVAEEFCLPCSGFVWNLAVGLPSLDHEEYLSQIVYDGLSRMFSLAHDLYRKESFVACSCSLGLLRIGSSSRDIGV
jgi:hypothetical protein